MLYQAVQRLISLAERRLPSAVATVTTYVPGARVSTSIVAVVPVDGGFGGGQ